MELIIDDPGVKIRAGRRMAAKSFFIGLLSWQRGYEAYRFNGQRGKVGGISPDVVSIEVRR